MGDGASNRDDTVLHASTRAIVTWAVGGGLAGAILWLLIDRREPLVLVLVVALWSSGSAWDAYRRDITLSATEASWRWIGSTTVPRAEIVDVRVSSSLGSPSVWLVAPSGWERRLPLASAFGADPGFDRSVELLRDWIRATPAVADVVPSDSVVPTSPPDGRRQQAPATDSGRPGE
jgi:hypothetical protein